MPRSPSLLLGDDDFAVGETPAATPLVKHRYVLGGAPGSLDMSDIVDSAGTFAPLGDIALMGGMRHVAVARGPLLRVGQ